MESSVKGIALDTSVLVSSHVRPPDVLPVIRETVGSNVLVVIPVQVSDELNILSRRSRSLSKSVAIARELLSKYNVAEKKVDAVSADDALEKLARSNWVVATNDKKLSQRIRALSGHALELSHGRIRMSF